MINIKGGKIVSGKVYLKGKEIYRAGKDQKPPKGIALVFQNPMSSFSPYFTIKTQLRDILKARDKIYNEKEVEEMLKMMGFKNIQRVLNSYPHELSGGMLQRLCIAFSLLSEADLLIAADEPTSSVDVVSQAYVLEVFRSLIEQHRIKGLLFITHDIMILEKIAQRIYVMYRGEIIEEGKTQEILENPLHPYTRLLVESSLFKNPNYAGKDIGERLDKGCSFYHACPKRRQECREKEVPYIQISSTHRVRCIYAEANS